MPPEVSFCERSTITEAWALAVGLPAPVITEEPSALVLAARRRWPDLEMEPFSPPTLPNATTTAPTWLQQWIWGQRRHLARIGHRYLSVHVLADERRPYETYEASLKPVVQSWLEVCRDVYSDPHSTYSIGQVAFGYVNTFWFPQDEFDLSKVVRLQLGVTVPSASRGLTNLQVDVAFEDPESNAFVELVVAAEPVDEAVMVKTRVTALQSQSDLSFAESAEIERAIGRMKGIAKRVFFEFVTEKIHEEMGVHHVSND